MRTAEDLKQLQSLPLATKILWSLEKIREGIEGARAMGRPVHMNDSGGMDSTALGRLTEMAGIKVPVVFANTGMEFNAIARLGRQRADVVVQPRINFAEVVKRCGYPAISKQQARYLHDLQNPTERNRATRTLRMTGHKKDGTPGKRSSMLSRRYIHLIGGPKIGDGCCHHLKEAPLDDYSKNTNGSIPITGIQAEESDRRARDWINWGCVGLKKGTPKIAPMMIWRKTDVLEFVMAEGLEYCREIYGEIAMTQECDGCWLYTTSGEKRTGCVGCLFGCFHDPQRFVRLYKIDRAKWQYLMDAGAREVLVALGLPAYPGQYETVQLFGDVSEAC